MKRVYVCINDFQVKLICIMVDHATKRSKKAIIVDIHGLLLKSIISMTKAVCEKRTAKLVIREVSVAEKPWQTVIRLDTLY